MHKNSEMETCLIYLLLIILTQKSRTEQGVGGNEAEVSNDQYKMLNMYLEITKHRKNIIYFSKIYNIF